MNQLWNFLTGIPIQLWVVIAVFSFSAIGSIAKKLKQQAEQRKLDGRRKRAEYEAVRTGQTAPPEPDVSSEEAERRRRLEQLAAQRKAQLEELRRRREAQRQQQQRPMPPVQTSTTAPPPPARRTTPPTPARPQAQPRPVPQRQSPQRPSPQPRPQAPQRVSVEERVRREAYRRQQAAAQPPKPQAPSAILPERVLLAEQAAEFERQAALAAKAAPPVPHGIAGAVRTRAGLRQALILSEVLGPPMAARQNPGGIGGAT